MGTRRDHENQAIEDLRSYGRSLAGTVSTGQTEAIVGRAMSARQRPHRPRRLVLALATLGLLAISNVGLAAVADTAAPGDLLYPLDRGYERAGDLFGGWLFGVSNRTQERLAESDALNLRGETEEAIAFLRDELTVESSDAELLVAAIDKLESEGNQGQGNPNDQSSQNDSGPATPAETAPGQVDEEGNGQNHPNPSDTAPGNGQDDETGGSPSDDAPGQNKDKDQNKDEDSKDNPSDDAPGQNPDTTTTSAAPGNGNGNGNGNDNGNGNGNGNNGQGDDGP